MRALRGMRGGDCASESWSKHITHRIWETGTQEKRETRMNSLKKSTPDEPWGGGSSLSQPASDWN